MNKRYLIFLALLLVVSISLAVPIEAQSISKTSTLTHFDVTLTFPKTTKPGDSILISVSATARSSVRVRDLSVQVLAYVEGGDLQSVGSASLATDQSVSKGNTLRKEFSLTVPTSIVRGALVAVVSETTRSTGYSYYSYPGYYYYGYYPYYDYYHNYTGPYWYYPYYYYYYYPEAYSKEYVESKALPGPYVLADTPEYISLKSDYDNLSSDYQQLSSKYDELSVKYQEATERNNELNDKLSVATQDLNTTRILVFVFVAATIILAVFVAYLLYGRRRTVEAPATAGYAPASTSAGASSPEPEKVAAAPEKKEVPK